MTPWRNESGHSTLEVAMVVTLVAVLAATGLSWGGAGLARARGRAAARRVALWCAAARTEAVRGGRAVGVLFDSRREQTSLQLFADTAGNGVTLADILAGTDRPVGPAWFLHDDYPGVEYAIRDRLPEVEGTGWLEPGSDPIRAGVSNLLIFTPVGTASGGTVYLRGKDGAAYAIRILGATARIRVLQLDRATRRWTMQ